MAEETSGGGSGQKVGSLYYEVTLDTSKMIEGERKAEASTQSLKATLTEVSSAIRGLTAAMQAAAAASAQAASASLAAAKSNSQVGDAAAKAAAAEVEKTVAMHAAAAAAAEQAAAAKAVALAEREKSAAQRADAMVAREQAAAAKAAADASAAATKQAAAAEAANRKAADAAAKAAANTGKQAVSAGQLSAAMRNLPAQFTDIVVGLQAGQSPLTVLLQQGGQLKDMFGGVAAAARGLVTYVASLLTPVTAVAAAIATLTVGFAKGNSELGAFTRSLTLTGNQSGVTADQLNGMANRMDGLANVTRGQAAEALNTFVAAGIRGAQSLEAFTSAAIRLEQAGGPAVEDTAKAFKDLEKEPTAAAAKLNETVNFLTASLFKQIQALEDQGKATEAAKLAQDAFAAAINQRAPEILQNLGLIERVWVGIKGAVREAGDAILAVGRSMPLTDKLKEAEAQLDKIKAKTYARAGDGQRALAAQQALVDSLRQEVDATTKSAAAQQALAEQGRAAKKFALEGDKYLDKRAKMEKEITEQRALGLAGKVEEKDIEERIAAIRKKYAEKGPKVNAQARTLAAQEYYEALVAANKTGLDQIDAEEQRALTDNQKRQAIDRANSETYARAKTEIYTKFARERALVEEQTQQQIADLGIMMTTDQVAKIDSIRAESFRRADALEQLGQINHAEAERMKTAATFEATRQRAAIQERATQANAENEIELTLDALTKIDLVRQENIRRADAAVRAGTISAVQGEAEKARAAIDAQNAIRGQVMSVNPLAQLQREYEEKLAIVRFYEQQIAQAGVDGQTFVEEKRTELAYQFQQQRLALATAEFANQSAANQYLVSTLDSLASSASSSLSGLLQGTLSAQEAMRQLGGVVLNETVGALVQVGLQYIKNALIGQAADKALLASKAANGVLYAGAIKAQVAVTSALAAQNAFAATAAIPIIGPFIAAEEAAAAGAAAATYGAPAVAGAALAGARRYGGPVSASSLYRVNESGRPEMFTASNGSQYMMPTADGRVTAADKVGGDSGPPITVIINNAPPGTTATYNQQERTVEVAVAMVADQIANNSGKVWNAMRTSTNVVGRM